MVDVSEELEISRQYLQSPRYQKFSHGGNKDVRGCRQVLPSIDEQNFQTTELSKDCEDITPDTGVTEVKQHHSRLCAEEVRGLHGTKESSIPQILFLVIR